MILSDRDIKKALLNKTIIVTPAPNLDTQLGSCSLDLRLGNTFRVFHQQNIAFIDPNNIIDTNTFMTEITKKDDEPFILQPGDFVLAITKEIVSLPDTIVGRLEGRSSLGRLGIVVHSTASVVDPGWNAGIVLELGNLGKLPVALYPNMRICALTFEELSSPAEVPYSQKKSAKYIHQTAPLGSKIGEDDK